MMQSAGKEKLEATFVTNTSLLVTQNERILDKIRKLGTITPFERSQDITKCSKVVLSRVLLMAYSSILFEYVLDSTYS